MTPYEFTQFITEDALASALSNQRMGIVVARAKRETRRLLAQHFSMWQAGSDLLTTLIGRPASAAARQHHLQQHLLGLRQLRIIQTLQHALRFRRDITPPAHVELMRFSQRVTTAETSQSMLFDASAISRVISHLGRAPDNDLGTVPVEEALRAAGELPPAEVDVEAAILLTARPGAAGWVMSAEALAQLASPLLHAAHHEVRSAGALRAHLQELKEDASALRNQTSAGAGLYRMREARMQAGMVESWIEVLQYPQDPAARALFEQQQQRLSELQARRGMSRDQLRARHNQWQSTARNPVVTAASGAAQGSRALTVSWPRGAAASGAAPPHRETPCAPGRYRSAPRRDGTTVCLSPVDLDVGPDLPGRGPRPVYPTVQTAPELQALLDTQEDRPSQKAVQRHRNPWMGVYIRNASPEVRAALQASSGPPFNATTGTLAQARARIHATNQLLNRGMFQHAAHPAAFVQAYLETHFPAVPEDLIQGSASLTGTAIVIDILDARRRFPGTPAEPWPQTQQRSLPFSCTLPMLQAIIHTPDERCSSASIGDLLRRDRADGRNLQLAAVQDCQTHWPVHGPRHQQLHAALDNMTPPLFVTLRRQWDTLFSTLRHDAGYMAALAQQFDLFMSARLDDLRLRRRSTTLAGVPAPERRFHAGQAQRARIGRQMMTLLKLQDHGVVADGLILLPGRHSGEYLAIPVCKALPARTLRFVHDARSRALVLDDNDIDWLGSFFAPDLLQKSIDPSAAIPLPSDPRCTRQELERSGTRHYLSTFTLLDSTDPIATLSEARLARQQQAGRALLRSQDELDAGQRARLLSEIATVATVASFVLPFGQALLPEMLALDGTVLTVLDGAIGVANYGGLAGSFAAGWEQTRADADNPDQARKDVENLLESAVLNLLLLTPGLPHGAGRGAKLRHADQQLAQTRARSVLARPATRGPHAQVHMLGEEQFIALEGNTLHRVRWDPAARGYRGMTQAEEAAGKPLHDCPLFKRRRHGFKHARGRRKGPIRETDAAPAPGGAEADAVRRGGGQAANTAPASAAAAGHQSVLSPPLVLPEGITRTPVPDSPYVLFAAAHHNGQPATSTRLTVVAHGYYLSAENELAAGTVPVSIPADVTVQMAAPHGEFLNANLDSLLNPPAGTRPYVTLKVQRGAVSVVDINFMQDQPELYYDNMATHFNPMGRQATLGRTDGLQNYRHHLGGDPEQEIADSVHWNRQQAQAEGVAATDVLAIGPEHGVDSSARAVAHDTGVQRVLDLIDQGRLTNPAGQKYTTVYFAHCRNLETAAPGSVQDYYITAEAARAAEAAAQPRHRRHEAQRAPPLQVTLEIYRRDDDRSAFRRTALTFTALARTRRPLRAPTQVPANGPRIPAASPSRRARPRAEPVR
ncbi:hypothetical protein RZA67_08825 [Stenotrophomonas sp. C3(2023)]|uniref:putative adhesin n=1 Tax=Stenotrophomonas sp. C3(2023) TaxID=3080277 RepID=UPI00293CB8BF|nr:hypothetical protein [Stenotrophomonas sp. C3(2023)]MDV3468829.1 hypothetical protein [Stenotrophomonas sp. C3(2023)]